MAADRDWHFADAEDVEHVELPGREGERIGDACGLNFQREGVCILLTTPPNAKRLRNHGIYARDARLIKQVGHRNRVTACAFLGAAAT